MTEGKMQKINPEWVQAVKSTINVCPYFKLQQMELKDLSWGESRIEIQLGDRHLQPFGIVHGGVLSTLLDAAGFWAVYSKAEENVGMTTVELKINYLAPIISGVLFGMGRCIKLGRSIGLGDARIENEKGRLIAHGTTTVMVQPDLSLNDERRDITKFL
jgi:uncharacterized protein (TIGR00369 family)